MAMKRIGWIGVWILLCSASCPVVAQHASGSDFSVEQRTLETKAQELREEIRQLEAEKSHLRYTTEENRRRNELGALINQKRHALSAQQRQLANCR